MKTDHEITLIVIKRVMRNMKVDKAHDGTAEYFLSWKFKTDYQMAKYLVDDLKGLTTKEKLGMKIRILAEI